jgi:hypothetical protein
VSDELLDTARKFNEAVASTAAVGALRADIADMRTDLSEMKADVKHIRTTIDRWGGAIAISSAAISIAVTLLISLFK